MRVPFFLDVCVCYVIIGAMRYLWGILSVLCMGLASCLVCTSDALVRSCRYLPRETEEMQPQIYRLGEQYYLRVNVRYVCSADKVLVAGMIAVPDAEVHLPISYHDAWEPETVYALMDADAVKRYLGVKVSEPAKDTPHFIKAEDWDAAAATACTPIRPLSKKIEVHSTRFTNMEGCNYRPGSECLVLWLPPAYGWDAWYKRPLALVLLLGVDVPGSVVCTAGGLAVGSVATLITAPAQQQQNAPVEPPAPEKAEE